MVEDSELLRRFAREGCQAAFAELVTRHVDRTYAVALRCVGGDAHLAEDVAQTVFATLARKAASLTAHPALSAWIHRTAHDAAVDAVRGETRRRAREERAHAMQELHGAPAHDAAWEKLRPELDAAMAGLPERDRAALALRFFEDRPFGEIGMRLALTEDAARMRVDRALEKMRALLARRGITCTAAALGAAIAAPGLVAAPSSLAATITTTALAASAATAAGLGAGSLFSLMSSTKLVTGVTAAIVVLAVGTATYDSYTYTPASLAAVSDSTAFSASAAAELREVEARRAAVVSETETIRAEIGTLRKERAEATLRLVAPQRSANTEAEELGRAFMERHPEVRQAFHDWKDAQTRLDYGALIRKLQLTPEQVDRFLALKRAGGTVSGTWGPGETLMTLRADGSASTAEIEALLGPVGFEAYREHERAKMERRAAMDAASYLCFTTEPLTADQTDELTRILVESRVRQVPGSGAERYAWDRVSAAAATILTPAQRTVLDALRADDRYRAALGRSVP